MIERLLTRAARFVPRERREWADALLAELPNVPEQHRSRWLRGGLWLLVTTIAHRAVVYGVAAACCAIVVALADRSSSDVANQLTLLLLLIFSAALGALRPRVAWLSALLVGGSIAAARAIAFVLGATPADPQAPHSWAAIASLLILLVPAALAAYAGAAVGRRLRPSSHT